jgi:hypothetical protein
VDKVKTVGQWVSCEDIEDKKVRRQMIVIQSGSRSVNRLVGESAERSLLERSFVISHWSLGGGVE